MSFETYQQIYAHSEDITLRKGQKAVFQFLYDSNGKNLSHRLFFTGQSALFYFWKAENDCNMLYSNIEDALDSSNANLSTYCLNFTNRQGTSYQKMVFKKITWPVILSYLPLQGESDLWDAGVWVRAENLHFQKGGYVRMRFEIRYEQVGVSHRSTAKQADEVVVIEIPAGTYDWTNYRTKLNLPKEKMANLCCYIEAEGYTGTLLFERPYVTSSNGYNILPEFEPSAPDRSDRLWMGCNLSRKEWPEFELSVNGTAFYKGELFERCHVYSECEKNIPNGLIRDGNNLLEIKLISDYPNPLPYRIHEVGMFSVPHDEFHVISCPENAPAGGKAHLLIQTNREKVRIRFESESSNLSARDATFDAPGLHVYSLQCGEEENEVSFALISQDHREEMCIRRIVEKQEDSVLTGSGDLIYVNQESREDFEEFLKWYLSSNIGNLMTLRPTYRWSGGRVLCPENWRYLTDILNEMDIKYAHIIDGRELPGAWANPTPEMISGKGFLGRQSHEYDGQYIYWGPKELTEQYAWNAVFDCWMRIQREHPITSEPRMRPENYITTGDRVFIYRDPDTGPDDMEEAANLFIRRMAETRRGHTRNSGPSTAFKYFAQAGFDWLCAELLYGPTEIICGFLRGAASCYHQPSIGGHLAIQWSSTPHDTPARYRRFRTALYVCYMQGLHEINTEEGFWHIEEYFTAFHRNSEACLQHLKQQNDFYNFVTSHSRTGSFYTSFAFVFGRYDGFRSFGKDAIWGYNAFQECDAERSWELMRVFYPLTPSQNMIYLHPCPEEPCGFFTGTPRGNCDAIPIESEQELLDKYQVLAFAGYNKALPEDCDKLYRYVENGGTLVIGWPHLSVTTKRKDVENYRHSYIDHPLLELVAGNLNDFGEDSIAGNSIFVNGSVKSNQAQVLVETDGGQPLVLKYEIGKGSIYFVNAREYPAANEGLMNVYQKILISLSDQHNKQESVWMHCGDDVQFAVYKQMNGAKHIYVMAVDWYHAPEGRRKATLRVGQDTYAVEIPFGCMIKIVTNGTTAAWVDSESGEVTAVTDEKVFVHGRGSMCVYIAKDGKLQCQTLDFTDKAAQAISVTCERD